MDERLAVIKNVLIKRIIFILFFGIVCSGLLVFEKAKFTDFHIKTGGFQTCQVFRINDSKDRSNPYYEFDYKGLLNTNHNFDCIINDLEKSDNRFFVFINKNWDKWSRNQQIDWLRQKMQMNYFRDNTYEVYFSLKTGEVIDIAFLTKNADHILDSFLLQSANSIKMIKPNAEISLVSRITLPPKNVPLNKRDFLKKYAVIGFVFGVVIASMAFSIKALRDYK